MGRVQDDNCAKMPLTFFEALASCIVKNTDGDTFLNVICYNNDCADLESGFDCAESPDPELAIVSKLFAVDSCGMLALKLRVCVAADAENAPEQ